MRFSFFDAYPSADLTASPEGERKRIVFTHVAVNDFCLGSTVQVPRFDWTAIRSAGSDFEYVTVAMSFVHQLNEAIAKVVRGSPPRLLLHHNLYGPDEMSHTDGRYVSFNLASHRLRSLFLSVAQRDATAAIAAADLLIHELAHVGASDLVNVGKQAHDGLFYREKAWIVRRLRRLPPIDVGIWKARRLAPHDPERLQRWSRFRGVGT